MTFGAACRSNYHAGSEAPEERAHTVDAFGSIIRLCHIIVPVQALNVPKTVTKLYNLNSQSTTLIEYFLILFDGGLTPFWSFKDMERLFTIAN